MSRRDDLIAQFLASVDGNNHPITTHVDSVEAELIIDGDQYFSEIFEALDPPATDPLPNAVLILGWTFNTATTHGPHGQIGDILASLRTRGVSVHLVLNGSQFQNQFGLPFQQSLEAFKDLRMRRGAIPPAVGPLDQNVLLDFSGASLTGSQHQKAIVIQTGDDVVAYIGGIDMDPNRDDDPTHTGANGRLTKNGKPWGWHDAAIRLRGAPVADAWANFESRYKETLSLPVISAYNWNPVTGFSAFRNPTPGAPLPSRPVIWRHKPNTDIAVQVLRSRFPVKFPRKKLMWTGPPAGGIRQVHATLSKAINAAKTYIYIEDQYIGDTYDADDDTNAKAVSLLPALLAAAQRGVKIIMLTSGKADGPSFPTLPPRTMQNQVIDRLTGAQQRNVSIWMLTDRMVHSKLTIIDDVFAAVGSANLHSRSMWGIDQELHVAVVDAKTASGKPAGVVRDWRVRLWLEHLDVLDPDPPFKAQMQDLDTGLAMWRQSWRVGGTGGIWLTSNNPANFKPARIRRTFVGPPPAE